MLSSAPVGDVVAFLEVVFFPCAAIQIFLYGASLLFLWLGQMTSNIRKLLSPKNTFLWLDIHNDELIATKNILCSPLIIKPFDPNLTTHSITGGSLLNSLGFALIQ